MAKLDQTMLSLPPQERAIEMYKRIQVGTYFKLNAWEETFLASIGKAIKFKFNISKAQMDKLEEIYEEKV